MNEKEVIKKLEEMGYNVEDQPKWVITTDEDEEFEIQTNDLEGFYNEVKDL